MILTIVYLDESMGHFENYIALFRTEMAIDTFAETIWVTYQHLQRLTRFVDNIKGDLH